MFQNDVPGKAIWGETEKIRCDFGNNDDDNNNVKKVLTKFSILFYTAPTEIWRKLLIFIGVRKKTILKI